MFSFTLSHTTAENEKIHIEPEMNLNFISQLKASVYWLKHRKEKRQEKDEGSSYTEKYYVTLLIYGTGTFMAPTSTINADMV